IFTSSGSRRWVVKRDWPGRRRSRSCWISAALSGIFGGQPSTTHPIAAPWLSPKVVTRNRWPKVLWDIGFRLPGGLVARAGGGVNQRDGIAQAVRGSALGGADPRGSAKPPKMVAFPLRIHSEPQRYQGSRAQRLIRPEASQWNVRRRRPRAGKVRPLQPLVSRGPPNSRNGRFGMMAAVYRRGAAVDRTRPT